MTKTCSQCLLGTCQPMPDGCSDCMPTYKNFAYQPRPCGTCLYIKSKNTEPPCVDCYRTTDRPNHTPICKSQPDHTAKHKQILINMHNTYKRKNADYGDSFHRAYQKRGIISAITRMEDKWMRFEQLATHSDNPQVKDESIYDTLIDLANYAIMTAMEIQGGTTDED